MGWILGIHLRSLRAGKKVYELGHLAQPLRYKVSSVIYHRVKVKGLLLVFFITLMCWGHTCPTDQKTTCRDSSLLPSLSPSTTWGPREELRWLDLTARRLLAPKLLAFFFLSFLENKLIYFILF